MSNNCYPEAYAVDSKTQYLTGVVVGQADLPSAPPANNGQSMMTRQYSRNYTVVPNEFTTKEFLTQHQWPMGLQNLLLKNVVRVPYRFFICDDSGSMATSDGKRFIGNGNATKVVSCTRWAEMTESLKFHAALANALNMPSEFRLLNSSTPIVIGGMNAQPEGQAILETLFNESPGGGTPLCRHIKEVTARIREMEPTLRSLGQRVAIIIMTDGEASDGELDKAMAPLQQLPVWVVIRLCTDNDAIVEYWNNIDEKLELEMDVLDDLLSEGKEVQTANPWLNYTEPFHRLREFGIHMKEMDLLDEQCLSPEQIRLVCSNLLDVPVTDLPHPEADVAGFIRKLNILVNEMPAAYSLGKKRMMPLIEMNAIRRHVGKEGFCNLS